MGWTRAELKMRGKAAMSRSYWKMVLSAFLLTLATGSAAGLSGSRMGSNLTLSSLSDGDFDYYYPGGYDMMTLLMSIGALVSLILVVGGLALRIFLFNVLEVGAQRVFIINRVQDPALGELGFPFNNSYLNVVKTQFLRGLFASLWTMLLIVPGIVKSYEYRMIPYILAENPGIDTQEAFRLSKTMMDGEKMNAFVLDLSFIGWHLLSLFTCGFLDIFYTNPYQAGANAELYDTLKGKIFGGTPSF